MHAGTSRADVRLEFADSGDLTGDEWAIDCDGFTLWLDAPSVLELVRTGVGQSGHCRDYLVSTVSHLEELGILDRPLDALARRLDLR